MSRRSWSRFHAVAAERRGEGNAHPVERYGMERHADPPDLVYDAHTHLGGDSDLRDDYETWRSLSHPHVVQPEHRLLTGQQWVSGSHVERTAARSRGAGVIEGKTAAVAQPTIYQHTDGSHWVIDGHHRIAVGRVTGRPVAARLVHHDTVKWLGEDD